MPNKVKFANGASRTAALAVRSAPASLDENARSVEFVAATERAVNVFDWERWDIVPEVLLMSGVQLPASGQVPLLDSHERGSVSNVLGSFSGFRVENGQLLGKAVFSAAADGELAFQKVREGHVTDVSVGYEVLASTWVEPGATVELEGRTFTGPVRVTTAWAVREVSLCPIGADEAAKARAKAEHSNPERDGGREMPNKLNQKQGKRFDAKAAGEAIAAATAALQRVAESLTSEEEEEEKPEEERKVPEGAPEEEGAEAQRSMTEARPNPKPEEGDPVKAERQRVQEITAMCRAHNMPQDMADKLISEGTSMDKARAVVLERLSGRQSANFNRIEVGTTEQEKVRRAASQGLLLRCGVSADKVAEGGKLAEGARDFSGMTMREMARELLYRANQSTGGSAMEMMSRALSTTDLPMLLTETANRTLMEGWNSGPRTWESWASTGSLSDFRKSKAVDFAMGGELELIPEGDEYKNGGAVEGGEDVKLDTYGKIFAITRQALINDDLGVFNDIPRYHGEMAARLVNRLAYAALTANPVMADGNALFSAAHGNLVTGGGAPTVESLGAANLAMSGQTDIAGNPIDVAPQFFLAPRALYVAAETFFGSSVIGTAEKPNVTNIFGGNVLTRVYDAELDKVSATDWYLVGPKGRTVKVYFLNGQNTPYLEQREGWRVDGVEFKVRLDVGAKAIDWRGLVKSQNA